MCVVISYWFIHFLFFLASATTNRTVSMFSGSSTAVDTISLSWSVNGSSNETGYFIRYQRADLAALTPQWVFIEGVARSHNLTDLLGGTNYNITLTLVEGAEVSNEVTTSASTSEGSKCVVWWLNACLQVLRSMIALCSYPII